MTSNQASNSVMGYSGVSADLKGEQKGEFDIETKTGMLINSIITASINGNLQVMGKEIPIEIKTSIKMNGRKR
jgi:molybdopterin-binding protein